MTALDLLVDPDGVTHLVRQADLEHSHLGVGGDYFALPKALCGMGVRLHAGWAWSTAVPSCGECLVAEARMR